VESRAHAHGRFALRIPGRRARDYVEHKLGGGTVVTVRLCYRGSSAGTLVRLARNRVAVVSGRKGRLALKAGRRTKSLSVGRRSGGWLPLYVKLDARKNRVQLKGRGRRSVAIKANFRRERGVLVGHSGGRRGRAYYLDDVRVMDPSARGGSEQKADLSGTRLFARGSFWNKPLGESPALDPSSPTLVNTLASEAEAERTRGNGPWIETSTYTTPLYKVPRSQPTVRVALKDPSANWRKSLQKAFVSVPIPPGAKPAGGTDGHMTVWQPSTDKLWEFFAAKRDSGGNWSASWGGAIRHVSKSPGYFTRDAWPGAGPWWGATATSLPVIGGTMLLDELQQGRIDHALAMTIPNPRANVFSWPAQRSDGQSTSPGAIPEGARFRLDPKLDIEALQLPRLVKIMALAAQRYGVVVRDRSGRSIGFAAEDYLPTGTNPWWTPDSQPKDDGYFQGKWPSDLFRRFPWRSLQLVKMRTCSAETWQSCSWRR
jgi:hypothetical protein